MIKTIKKCKHSARSATTLLTTISFLGRISKLTKHFFSHDGPVMQRSPWWICWTRTINQTNLMFGHSKFFFGDPKKDFLIKGKEFSTTHPPAMTPAHLHTGQKFLMFRSRFLNVSYDIICRNFVALYMHVIWDIICRLSFINK